MSGAFNKNNAQRKTIPEKSCIIIPSKLENPYKEGLTFSAHIPKVADFQKGNKPLAFSSL